MKKKLMVSAGILSALIGFQIVSASNAQFTVSTRGEGLTLLSVNADLTSKIYNDGKIKNDDNRINAETELNTKVTIDNEDADGDSRNKTASISVNEDEDKDFEINGDDVRSNKSRGLIISEMAKVHSGNDFHLFVQSIVHDNDDIKGVTSEKDRVSMTRAIPVKFFGFIPIFINETAMVTSWGNGTNQVSINRSWLDFFSKNNVDKAKISSDLETKIKDIPTIEFKATLDAATKARIISEIQAVFKANGYATTTIGN